MRQHIISNGIIYFDSYGKFEAARLKPFTEIGRKPHIQGKSHEIVFLKNTYTGECAIKINHLRDSQVYIFENKDLANDFYKTLMCK